MNMSFHSLTMKSRTRNHISCSGICCKSQLTNQLKQYSVFIYLPGEVGSLKPLHIEGSEGDICVGVQRTVDRANSASFKSVGETSNFSRRKPVARNNIPYSETALHVPTNTTYFHPTDPQLLPPAVAKISNTP